MLINLILNLILIRLLSCWISDFDINVASDKYFFTFSVLKKEIIFPLTNLL